MEHLVLYRQGAKLYIQIYPTEKETVITWMLLSKLQTVHWRSMME